MMRKHNNNPNNILASVCRGKLSEGFDFPDDLARVIIVVGIPFPNVQDPKLILKEEYYIPEDRKFVWMRNDTIRAVNQCLGRTIRHINDFGSIYLVDERYVFSAKGGKRNQYQGIISKWLRDKITSRQQDLTGQEVEQNLKTFIKQNRQKFNHLQAQIGSQSDTQKQDEQEEEEQKVPDNQNLGFCSQESSSLSLISVDIHKQQNDLKNRFKKIYGKKPDDEQNTEQVKQQKRPRFEDQETEKSVQKTKKRVQKMVLKKEDF